MDEDIGRAKDVPRDEERSFELRIEVCRLEVVPRQGVAGIIVARAWCRSRSGRLWLGHREGASPQTVAWPPRESIAAWHCGHLRGLGSSKKRRSG